MKRQMFKGLKRTRALQAVLASVGVGIVGLSLLFVSFAAPDTVRLYLSPASKSVNIDGSFTVDIRVQTDKQINYARTYLDFPVAKLQVTSLSAAGSDFGNQSELTYSNTAGQVKITRYSNTQKTGSLLVARVTFQAKQNGSASVAFNSASKLTNGGYYGVYYPDLSTSQEGGAYTITTPATAPPPAVVGGPNTPPPATTTPPASTTPSSPPPSSTPVAAATPPPDGTDSLDPLPETEATPSSSDENTTDSPAKSAAPARRSRTAIVIAGVGVLAGLGAIGAAVLLNKRRPKITLPPSHDLSPEQVEAEMATSLLPRGENAESFNNSNQEAPAPEPADEPVAAEATETHAPAEASEAQSSASAEADGAVEAAPQPQDSAVPTYSEPSAEPPSPDPAAPAETTATNPDEPKDMFDAAEEQFHYDEKFKTPKK